MEAELSDTFPKRASYRTGTILIVLTVVACLAAIFLRTEIRSRYWAAQLIHAVTPEERALPLTLLCNAGDKAWWGINTLLAAPDGEIRQYGVLVLQHLKSPRSRKKLVSLLQDGNPAVRELAAMGLALQGDDSVVPELVRIFSQGDAESAASACVALERLGSPAASEALAELCVRPSDPARRAALIDACVGIATPRCAAGLLRLLDDHRPCQTPRRMDQMIEQLQPIIQQRGLPISTAATAPSTAPAAETVAERAAAGLSQITDLNPPYGSALSANERDAAARLWRQWVAEHGAAP